MHPIVEWYRRFFEDPGPGDGEQAVAAREVALGVKFPPALRAVLLHTTFRNSEQIHLRRLEDVELDADVLLFADEQQACGFWGIHRSELGAEDPPLVLGAQGEYHDDGCRLEAFLRFVFLANRPYEAPCVHSVALGDTAGWEQVTSSSKYASGSAWIRGEAVAFGDAVGAKTNEGLREALRSLGVQRDDEDLRLAKGRRKVPTHEERMRSFSEFVNRAWVVPPELVAVLGAGAVTKADAMSAVTSYTIRNRLRERANVRLDAVLEAASGLTGTVSLERLSNAVAKRLVTPAPTDAATHRPFPIAEPKGEKTLLQKLFGGWFGI